MLLWERKVRMSHTGNYLINRIRLKGIGKLDLFGVSTYILVGKLLKLFHTWQNYL